MLLQIYDGATTVKLSGGDSTYTTSYGCTFMPSTPGTGARSVTDTVAWILKGTFTNIRTATTAVQRLLDDARRRQARGVGTQVWLEYKPVDGDSSTYRSEILNGRLSWPDEPGLRRFADTSVTTRVELIIERGTYWEGARTALSCSTSKDTASTSEVTLYSNDDATATDTNYVSIAAAQVEGDLPAPIEMSVKIVDGSLSYPALYICNTVFADPANFDPFLLGAECDAASGSKSVTGTSTTTNAWVWRPSSAQLADCAGQPFHLLTCWDTSVANGSYLRARILTYVDTTPAIVYSVAYTGEWVYASQDEVVDLGVFPLPPGGYDTAAGAMAIGIDWRHYGNDTAVIDFIQLSPAGDGLWRILEQQAFSTEANDKFIDKPVEGLVYVEEAGGAHQPLLIARHNPILLWPNRINRLRIIMEIGSATWTAGKQLEFQAWYRPRRLTV